MQDNSYEIRHLSQNHKDSPGKISAKYLMLQILQADNCSISPHSLPVITFQKHIK